MDLYRRVRQAYYRDGKSVRQTARLFKLHRQTVRKMLEYSVPPGYQRKAAPHRPKLAPYVGIIDPPQADQSVLKKQRHTAKRIFERLRDEHGFPGHYTIVKEYVREKLSRAEKKCTGGAA